MPITPALRRKMQEYLEFEANLDHYIACSMSA
jgi:hypothetical protein